jgi:hypothetical protein
MYILGMDIAGQVHMVLLGQDKSHKGPNMDSLSHPGCAKPARCQEVVGYFARIIARCNMFTHSPL